MSTLSKLSKSSGFLIYILQFDLCMWYEVDVCLRNDLSLLFLVRKCEIEHLRMPALHASTLSPSPSSASTPTTMSLIEIQQKLSTISSEILSFHRNLSSSIDLSQDLANESLIFPLSPPSSSSCDQCQVSHLPCYRLCQNENCFMKLCSHCLFDIFELKGYHNTCPQCQQYLKYEVYQQLLVPIPRDSSSQLSTNVEDDIQILMKELISVICHSEERSDEDQEKITLEKSFESVVKKWDKVFEVVCDCGETHRLYEESKKVVVCDLPSLMKMLRSICGASHERQLIFLEILKKLILGQV